MLWGYLYQLWLGRRLIIWVMLSRERFLRDSEEVTKWWPTGLQRARELLGDWGSDAQMT